MASYKISRPTGRPGNEYNERTPNLKHTPRRLLTILDNQNAQNYK